jgi:hypothetical protein
MDVLANCIATIDFIKAPANIVSVSVTAKTFSGCQASATKA